MKKKLLLGIALFAFIGTGTVDAQKRFLDEVFTDSEIIIQKDIIYGVNTDFFLSDFSNVSNVISDVITLKTLQATNQPFPQKYFVPNVLLPPGDSTAIKLAALKMDVYFPNPGIDTMAARPVIVMLHTGSFIPTPKNGQATGSKADSSIVENAKLWAKKGFVAVAINYRGGWNPISGDAVVRRSTLLNAVYRAIHDAKQAVRVIKQTKDQGDPFAIDTDKFVIYGQGTGGYIALAYVTLDKPGEITIPKFLDPNTGNSYIDTTAVGNYDGYDTQTQPSISFYLDTFNYSNEVQMCVNAGGSLADSSWLEAGDPAMVTIMCVRDPFAPFDHGTVIVPVTGEDVVDVDGPNVYIPRANKFGNNDAFYNLDFGADPYTKRARSLYGTTWDYIKQPPMDKITIDSDADGLFPIIKPLGASEFENTGAPWDWWSLADLTASVQMWNAMTGDNLDANAINNSGLASNPNGNDASHGRSYVDTIQGYANPRIMRVLQIGDYEGIVSVREPHRVNELYAMYPNPAGSFVELLGKQGAINSVEIYDITGKLVMQNAYRLTQVRIDVSSLPSGVYFINAETDSGSFMEKLIIE